MDLDTLNSSFDQQAEDRRLIVVSHRQPYIHWHGPEGIECGRPKGAVPRAFDQRLRVEGGTWVAHGSGNADRIKSSANGVVSVPPQNPQYNLKRIWLTKQQEKRYYYGFSCCGLWSMCHQLPPGTALRPDQFLPYDPAFFEDHWKAYREVNTLFAEAAAEEAAEEPSLIWVMDYPMALVPELVRERMPSAMVASGWFLPWPQLALLKCCPWITELVNGMLGSDILYFDSRRSLTHFMQAAGTLTGAQVDPRRAVVRVDQREVSLEVFSLAQISVPPEANRVARQSC